tara:strand:+ start:1770 stop:2027 length:258 start_codon:yes stop_codon:yes gene_type:complete
MVEWENGEVTVWNKVTHENGLTIPLDQLESIIKKAMPDAFRSQSIVPTESETHIKCFYQSGLEYPESKDDAFAGISLYTVSKRSF